MSAAPPLEIHAPQAPAIPLGPASLVDWFAYIGPPRPTPAISNEARQAATLLARQGLGLRANDRSVSDDAAVAAAVSAGGAVRRYTSRRGPAGGFDAPLRRFPEALRREAFAHVEAAKPGAKRLTAPIRERLTLLAFQILGDDLKTPARLLVVHVPPHALRRVAGTLGEGVKDLRGAAGVAVSIAEANGVPVLSLPAPILAAVGSSLFDAENLGGGGGRPGRRRPEA